FSIVNCSGSSTGAPNADVDLAAGGGGALGLGTAIARRGEALAPSSGVSDGLGEAFFFGVGDFSPVVFFFFFVEVSLAADFFAFGFGVASGVSLGVGDASDSAAGVFFAFAFGFAEAEAGFFFLRGEVFALGVGLVDSSADDDFTARALRSCGAFSSSVGCA